MAKDILKKVGTVVSVALNGLRDAETDMLTTAANTDGGVVHEATAETDRVAQAMLKGEVTQAVKELRYRTYKVDREAQRYTYFAPTLAKRNNFDKDDDWKVKFENSEGLPLVTIQENSVVQETVLDAIKQIGEHGVSPDHRIKVGRSIVPRYDIEKYAKRLAVKDCGDGQHAILDFYVSAYKVPGDRLQNWFVNEVRKMCNEGYRSNIYNIDTVEFVTQRAYKQDDLVYFKFDNVRYRGTVEFDGSYVIKFKAAYVVNEQDLVMTDYFCPELEKRYQENTMKKHHSLNLTPDANDKEIVCDVCGKKVKYDEQAVLDAMETDDPCKTSYLEYFDMQVIEATYGRKMCYECFEKFYDEELKKLENT